MCVSFLIHQNLFDQKGKKYLFFVNGSEQPRLAQVPIKKILFNYLSI